jgi:insulysin
LSAGGSARLQHSIDQFKIDITLTEKGEQNYQRVLELVYSYINKIKAEGIKRYVFDEIQKMSKYNFDNITKTTALNYAQTLCYRMMI